MEIEEDVKQYPWRRNKIEETKITFEENENEDDRYWNPKSQKNFGNKTSQRKKIFPPQWTEEVFCKPSKKRMKTSDISEKQL